MDNVQSRRVYADAVEQEEMKICHPHCIGLLNQFLASIEHHSRFRALDVAGGDGRLTEHFLTKQYPRVDLFDLDADVVEEVKKAMETNVNFGYACAASMEDFKWEFSYSAIYMVWVSGYLNDTALAAFLRRAKTQLMKSDATKKRGTQPSSFIFLFDNVLGKGEKKDPLKGQRFRTVSQFESVFVEAGLFVHGQLGPKPMPEPFMDVKVWALY